jgi:hypothetical protein
MDIDPKEMMKFTEVCHGKFSLQRGDNGAEQRGGVGCQNYVVNI